MVSLRTLRFGLWLCVALLGLLIVIWLLTKPEEIPQPSLTKNTTQLSLSFNLLDHNGNTITGESMRGKRIAVFFGFTHCPEICPTTLHNLNYYIQTLAQEGLKLSGFFVTVDPIRDTPEVLKTHLEDFQDRITGITGPAEEVSSLLKRWSVYVKIIPLEESNYTIDHTSSVYLIDERGMLQNVLRYQESSDEALVKLKQFVSREP